MLKSECSVCGARRKFKSLVYDQSLNPYCSSAMNCVSFHPNSQKNYRERGTWTELLSYEEALQLQKQRTEYTYEESAHTFGKRVRTVNMHKLLTGSVSFRIQSETQADYISYILGKTGSNRITEAILFIINNAMEHDTSFLTQHTQNRVSYSTTPVTAYEVEKQPKEIPSRKPEADEGVFTI